MLRLKNRRGITLIIVGVSLVALVGIMAFAIDFGRMYLYRAQVHVSSDAAALAGTERLMRQDYVNAASTAVAYGLLNQVENVAPTIAAADVEPGAWNFTTRTFTPAVGGSWNAAGNNAVRATSRFTAGYVFGRIFGLNTKLRSATSVAAVGYVGATDCMRPMVLPYQALLDVLFPPAGSQTIATHPVLDTADVSKLARMTILNQITLAGKGNGPLGSGTFGGARLPPIQYADGTVAQPWQGSSGNWERGLGATCAGLLTLMKGADPFARANIGVGDWLAEDEGVATSAQSEGIQDLCNLSGNGGTSPSNPGGNNSFTCNVPVPIKVAISSTLTGGRFLVKYVGEFAVTGYVKNAGISGYFIGLPAAGQFTPIPSPLKKIALVQ